ncbi:unnamed protein product [Urochloa decumbens]|uniref:F-box domain-containing protein n=1 Tax=Urochloa decumbens TaxID=240449 RepID=A0ABC9G6D8_9POAL
MHEATSQGRDWSSLPADLLRKVLARLPWSSHPSFAATCAHWRSAVSPFYPSWITPVLLSAANVGSTNLRLYSPYYHKNFELDQTLASPGAKLCCARGHRVMLYHRVGDDNVVVVANLLTGDILDLYLPECTSFNFVVYDYDGDREMLFGVDAHVVLQAARSVRSGDGEGWCAWEFPELWAEGSELTASPVTNPVLHRGLLYLLGAGGRLAVHDDSRHDEGFRILDMPKGFGIECDDCYLFESDEGELMAVLMGHNGSPVHVVRLNEERMEWEKADSLKGRSLFTGTLTTMMVKTGVKWMQDKVFTPRLYDWPETISVELVEREGELAFVPISTRTEQYGGACGKSIWACGLGPQQTSKFWETINFDYSIWVDFSS